MSMLGPVLIVLTLLIGLPISFFVIGTVLSVLLGQVLTKDAARRHEGSELIDVNI